jgi:glycerophosphoryl diester phosphodiesterase
MDTIKINKGNAQIVAHRGLSGLERENTASAFVAAGNRSYFGIETDVRVTADGNFILLHDDDAVRCGGDYVIPEKSTSVEAV